MLYSPSPSSKCGWEAPLNTLPVTCLQQSWSCVVCISYAAPSAYLTSIQTQANHKFGDPFQASHSSLTFTHVYHMPYLTMFIEVPVLIISTPCFKCPYSHIMLYLYTSLIVHTQQVVSICPHYILDWNDNTSCCLPTCYIKNIWIS